VFVTVCLVLGVKPDEFLDCLRFGEDADVFNWGEVDCVVFTSTRVGE
jgi:hypothetical protein